LFRTKFVQFSEKFNWEAKHFKGKQHFSPMA
jgi:hypothetical protein